MANVLIIGAGIIGLHTANTLLSAGHKVTILAKQWPGDESIEYTSPWAGAIWRTHADADKDPEQCAWNVETYRYWVETVEERPGEAEKMGIQRVPLTVYSNDEQLDPSSSKLWYSQHVQNFSLLQSIDNAPSGAKSGLSYTSFAISPAKYLMHLLTRAKNLGARTIPAELPTSQGLAHALSAAVALLPGEANRDVVVINCSGLGAKSICDDKHIYPIRGQTLLVRINPPPPFPRIILHDSTPVTYIVPRTGTDLYLLGGTNDADDWDPAPTPSTTASIMERCKEMMKGWVAQDAQIEIVAEQVGLRPGRKGGARVEVELVEVEGRKVHVVHQYGHAGAGYQNCVGSAGKVLGLVEEVLGRG